MRRAQANFSTILPLASLATCWMIAAPALAAPGKPPSKSLAVLSKEALLGFDRPDWRIQTSYAAMEADGSYMAAKSNLIKLLAGNPDSPFLIQENGLLLFEMGARRSGILQLERSLKLAEQKGEHFRLFYDNLVRSYVAVGDYANAAILLRRMQPLFPHSRTGIARSLTSVENKSGKNKVNFLSACKLTLGDIEDSTGTVFLKNVATPTQHDLAPGWAYQLVARTKCFPRFKCTLAVDQALGDTGVVQFLALPPSYNDIVLIQHESHNYFHSNIADLLNQLCSQGEFRPPYQKITQVCDVSISGVPCIQYKCQLEDDSAFDLVTLTREIPLRKELAQAASKICRVAPADCLVVNMARVTGGLVIPVMQTDSIKKIKFDAALFKLPASYHKVTSMAEFVYASKGKMNADDLNQTIKSR